LYQVQIKGTDKLGTDKLICTGTNMGVKKMKLIIPAVGAENFETEIHENFGRANYFAVINCENNDIKFVNNTAANKSGGAGVAAAQLCADQGADVMAAYHFGPKAYEALKAADIKLLDLNEQKLITEAFNDYQAGKLAEAEAGPGGHF